MKQSDRSGQLAAELLPAAAHLDHVWQVGGRERRVACQLEARPAASHFAWAFLGLAELAAKPAGQWEPPASLFGLESTSGELAEPELLALTKGGRPGLLLCRAANELGWQRRACRTLILGPGEQTGPAGGGS